MPEQVESSETSVLHDAMMPAKILVVDDEPDLEPLMLQKFRRQIRDGHFDLVFAQNGKMALEKLESDPEIHLVLTDINMPVMDGLTLLKGIRERGMLAKVVVMSAYGDLQNIRAAMNLGSFDFLTKPVDFGDLQITIDKTLAEVKQILKGRLAQENLKDAELAKERAEQSRQFKEQFLANMSHEIRTPMNAVLGMTNLLLKTELSELQSKYLNAIKKSADNLLVIINDILDISKIEAGKLEFESTDFLVSEVVSGVINTMMFKAEEKGLELISKIDENIPMVLSGDPVRLNQILLNLTGNAIKFTESGSVTISCQFRGMKDDKADLYFEVTDTGIGIAENKIASVFESFSQAESSTTRKYGGTGLGLTISKNLVEQQGGEIGLRSKVGVGTTFYFDIAYPLGNNTVEVKQPRSSAETDLGHIKLLLVEDNDFNQIVAQDTLESLFDDITIDIANNGKKGVDKVAANQYDIVLMDINMPEMNGYDATQAIRKLPTPRNKTLVMAMTASATKEEVDSCYNAGMDGYIAKPFVPEELKSRIVTLIAEHRNGNKHAADAPPPSILVVDDNEFNQMVAVDTLESLFKGARVESAGNGKIAIEKIQQQHFDIVLMDIQMPVMDGYEATHHIRKELKSPLNQIPIMAMTANVTHSDVEQCKAAGMNDYISKPFQPEELLSKINRLTGR